LKEDATLPLPIRWHPRLRRSENDYDEDDDDNDDISLRDSNAKAMSHFDELPSSPAHNHVACHERDMAAGRGGQKVAEITKPSCDQVITQRDHTPDSVLFQS
jgi:hypothetical protein